MSKFCENCKYFGYEPLYYFRTGKAVENSWGNYCARNGTHWNKHMFHPFTGEYQGVILGTSREANNMGDCKFYKRKWWKFWVKE